MTIAQVNQTVIAVIKESTETELDITVQTHLVKEMGLSSVEAMILLSDLEDRFDISIPAAELRNIQTVSDLCQVVISQLTRQ